MDFKRGDVVRLKSGGPKMTVTAIVGEDSTQFGILQVHGYSEGDVTVEYFNGSKLEKGLFKATSVEIVND